MASEWEDDELGCLWALKSFLVGAWRAVDRVMGAWPSLKEPSHVWVVGAAVCYEQPCGQLPLYLEPGSSPEGHRLA